MNKEAAKEGDSKVPRKQNLRILLDAYPVFTASTESEKNVNVDPES